MPAKKSAGPRPHLTHWRARRAQGTPAPARMRVALERSRSPSAPWVDTTAPRTPPSRTSRLLPRPIHRSGISGGSWRMNDARSMTLRGMKKRSAGPPTCQEVCLDIGTSRSTRAANSGGELVGAHEAAHAAAPAANRLLSSCATAPMLPAPMVSTTSPSRSTVRRTSARSSTRSTNTGSIKSAGAHGAADGAAVRARDRRLAGGVDLGHEQHVALAEHPAEIIQQVARTRIAMRLESEHQTARRPRLAHRVERGRDFGRMMSVVIDDERAPGRPSDLAELLQPPIDALKMGRAPFEWPHPRHRARWPPRAPRANSAHCAGPAD